MEMPQHFINIGERMEAVWCLLQVPDTAVVALIGMGGVGRTGILLLMFWHLWHFHRLGLDCVCVQCQFDGFSFCICTTYGHWLATECTETH